MKYVLTILALMLGSTLAFANGGATCSAAAQILNCPFSDAGNFDNDNDCGSPFSSPASEVFYTFTPSASGPYQFRLTTSASSIAIRVLSGACCSGGTSVGFSSTNIPNDCGETANKRTYLSVALVGGVQYWIHVGTNSGASTASYTLDMTCVPCPQAESQTAHATCETAQALACGDSVLGSGATSSSPDWYAVTLDEASDLAVWVGGRAWGHCISGFAPADAKYRLYAACGADNHLVEGVNEGCDDDATDTLHCLPAGTYYIKVFNNNENAYILKTTCTEPGVACPNVVVENQHCDGPCAGSLFNGGFTEYDLYVPNQYIITDLNVRVNILHGRDQDLTMWLVTPWNTQIELSSHNGANGMNYTNTVFDDEAGPSIICTNDACAPFTGSYRPEQPLSIVDGFNSIGTWTLKIQDINSLQTWTNDTGSVYCWCLEFDYDFILAVELSSFDASGVDGGVNLAWTTASEVSNHYFEILRDGELLAEVASRNSLTGSHYEYLDANLTAGRSYEYTLVAVDNTGARAILATANAVPGSANSVVTEYSLEQNFPNPFNPETTIRYSLPEVAHVQLIVVDALGREVATLVNSTQAAGTHALLFNATDLPTGLYFYRIQAGSFTDTQKMLLLK